MDPYMILVDTAIGLASALLGGLKNKAPVYVLSAGQAFLDALMAHKDDVVNKAALEAARG